MRPPSTATATCSIGLGFQSLHMRVAPGAASPAAMQVITNTGSLGIRAVEINATPWYVDPVGDRPYSTGHATLPSSLTELSTAVDAPRSFVALSEGGTPPSAALGAAPLAAGLAPDDSSRLWFRINMAGLSWPQQGGTLVQHVTYMAECIAPAPDVPRPP